MASPATDARGGSAGRTSLLGAGSGGTDAQPLFQDSLDRIAEACVPRLEKLAGENMSVTCSLASLTHETAGDALAPGEPTTTTALFEVPAVGSRLVVSLEDGFLQLFIEMMCGGICGEPPPSAPRPGTSIDRQFARIAFNTLSAVIEQECLGFGLQSVTFSQIQSKPDLGALGKRSARVAVATFALDCLNRHGNFRVVFPQIIMDRFKQDALPVSTQSQRVDPEWSERLKAEISRTVVNLDAFLDADSLTLGQVATLKPGQILTLPKTAASQCELRSDGKPLFRCELGQADGHYSLRIREGLPNNTGADGPITSASFFDPS